MRLHTLQRPLWATAFLHLPGGSGPAGRGGGWWGGWGVSLSRMPQSPETCPRSWHRGCRRAGPQPECNYRTPSLCAKITRETLAGTLRKVGGSGPARTGRGERAGRGNTCCGTRASVARPLAAAAARTGGARKGRSWGADEPGRPQVPGGFPASVSRPEAVGVGGVTPGCPTA